MLVLKSGLSQATALSSGPAGLSHLGEQDLLRHWGKQWQCTALQMLCCDLPGRSAKCPTRAWQGYQASPASGALAACVVRVCTLHCGTDMCTTAMAKGTSHVESCLSLRTGLLHKVQMGYKGTLFDPERSQAAEQVMQGCCAAWKFSRPSCMYPKTMWSDPSS